MARFTGSDRLDVLKAATKRMNSLGDDAARAAALKDLVDSIGTPSTTLETNLRDAVVAIAKARFPKAWASIA